MFFCQVLQQMGFGPMLLQLIRTFFVLNNGFATDLFPVIHGVRQGNPLSPLLFVLTLEILMVCQIGVKQSMQFMLIGVNVLNMQSAQYTCPELHDLP